MNIIIKTKNLELTKDLQSFINKKIGSLNKFLKIFQNHNLPIAGQRVLFDTFVEVKKETSHHKKGQIFKAEAILYLPGKNLFAQARGDNVINITNELRDELEREIKRYKDKIIEFPRRKARKKKRSKF